MNKMISTNVTHSFHRILGRIVSDRGQLLFCSWHADDCVKDVQINNISLVDCLAIKFGLTAEDLNGSLCCKSQEDVPFIEYIPLCSPNAVVKIVKIAVLIILLVTVILVCAKSTRNISRIILKFGFLSLRNSVGKCAFICAVAQLFVMLYAFTLICAYVALLLPTSLGVHNNISAVATITLPTSLSFAVFAALSMAFNIITVGRNAAMQGHDEKQRNGKRLTRLHRIITAVTIIYSTLFFGATLLPEFGVLISISATLLVSIFHTGLFHAAAQVMQDLNESIGNNSGSKQSRLQSGSLTQPPGTDNATTNRMHDILFRLQHSSSFISRVSAICAVLLILQVVNELVKFENVTDFNPVRFVSAALQYTAMLFFMFILDSITSTLYENKMGVRKVVSRAKVIPSVTLFPESQIAAGTLTKCS